MAEFIAEEGTLKGLVLSLTDADVWIIGRDPDECDLIVEDSKASRKHLLCRKTDEGILVENLSHSNPTRVNENQLFDPILLREGDKVQIGSTIFRFYSEKAPPKEMREEISEEEELFADTIFKEDDIKDFPPLHIDLGTSRFIFKVVAGPNTGAELGLDLDKEYTIGTDTATCDIVFHDLSISRQHARLRVDQNNLITIEDLGSRNGVIVNRERISGRAIISPNTLITAGTSTFIVIDKEAPLETIAAPVLEAPEEAEEIVTEPAARDRVIEEPVAEEVVVKERKPFPMGKFLLSLLASLFIIFLGVAMISLLFPKDVKFKGEDHCKQIEKTLAAYPGVRYTYNGPCRKVFLTGHVLSGIQKSEMLYTLKTLPCVGSIEDNVVDDEAIWQETNILLSKNPDFEGVSIHADQAGCFVLTGYLKTSAQAAALTDWLNVNFNFPDRLENCIVVEEEVLDEVNGSLLQQGLNGVNAEYTNGQLLLTGYIPSNNQQSYEALVQKFQTIHGVKAVRNYVVALTPEQAIVDLNERFPGKYKVTGFSKHGNINVNIVVNGCILMRGDTIDGMTITSIQAHTIFLEKDGLKYKIEYNMRECKAC
jgi:type III secretion system YscD/HrpQ family protein